VPACFHVFANSPNVTQWTKFIAKDHTEIGVFHGPHRDWHLSCLLRCPCNVFDV